MKLFTYFRNVVSEMNNIRWSSQKTVITYTVGVMVVVLLVAYYMGLLDFAFVRALRALMGF